MYALSKYFSVSLKNPYMTKYYENATEFSRPNSIENP